MSPLNEIVLFEIPARGAKQLLAELEVSRLAWMEGGGEVAVVGVLLNPDKGDLGNLLRTVEAWVAQHGLLAIRFEVDGRTFALQPAAGAQPQRAA